MAALTLYNNKDNEALEPRTDKWGFFSQWKLLDIRRLWVPGVEFLATSERFVQTRNRSFWNCRMQSNAILGADEFGFSHSRGIRLSTGNPRKGSVRASP